jgi:hypothetical protein
MTAREISKANAMSEDETDFATPATSEPTGECDGSEVERPNGPGDRGERRHRHGRCRGTGA